MYVANQELLLRNNWSPITWIPPETMAGWAGITRRSLERVLSDLRVEGLISNNRGYLHIPDAKGLTEDIGGTWPSRAEREQIALAIARKRRVGEGRPRTVTLSPGGVIKHPSRGR